MENYFVRRPGNMIKMRLKVLKRRQNPLNYISRNKKSRENIVKSNQVKESSKEIVNFNVEPFLFESFVDQNDTNLNEVQIIKDLDSILFSAIEMEDFSLILK